MAVKSSLGNMVICLGGITLVCALLLAAVYSVTMKPIIDAQNNKENQAIAAVSPEFESLTKGTTDEGNEYYIALDNKGDTVCYVVKASSAGFGGSLDIMAGFLPDGVIYRTAVLAQNETPGLGAKCCEEPFIGQFAGFDASTRKLAVKQDGGDVDAITAATITSRAFCAALNNAYQIFEIIRRGNNE